jgi:hypothetical protein
MEFSDGDMKDLKDLVVLHDKSIDKMALGLEHLATEVGSTNRKLSDIIDVIGKQNILMEKFTNLETNMKENLNVVHGKIRDIEQSRNSSGCSALKLANIREEGVDLRLSKVEGGISKLIWMVVSIFLSGAGGTLLLLLRGH